MELVLVLVPVFVCVLVVVLVLFVLFVLYVLVCFVLLVLMALGATLQPWTLPGPAAAQLAVWSLAGHATCAWLKIQGVAIVVRMEEGEEEGGDREEGRH